MGRGAENVMRHLVLKVPQHSTKRHLE